MERATRKLAELMIKANGKGAWGDHVIKETMRWRCSKVWKADRADPQERSEDPLFEGGEQLHTAKKVLTEVGEDL